MTSGTRITDHRYYHGATVYSSDCFGGQYPEYPPTYLLGSYEKKTWNGGNSPTIPWREDPLKFWTFDVPDGRGGYKRKKFRLHGTPRVNRSAYENGYTMELTKTLDCLFEGRNYETCRVNPPNPLHTQDYYLGHFSSAGFSAYHPRMWDANDENDLIGNLREAIQGAEFNMAISLAEGKASLATVTDAARRIALSAKKLRKGDFKGAARTFAGSSNKRGKNISRSEVTEDWFASNWLQLRYGWMPLVQDVFSAMNHLAHLQNRRVSMVYRGSKKLKQDAASASPSWTVHGASIQAATIKAKITHINELALLGLTDPLSVAWELVPYSFVFDWFVPVGNYLSASALNRSITATYVISRYDKIDISGASSTSADHAFYALGEWRHLSIKVNREVVSQLNVPAPVIKDRSQIPSWAKAITSIALLIQSLPRFGNR
jgi:hypothetical protein